jgi:hypothetical protein
MEKNGYFSIGNTAKKEGRETAREIIPWRHFKFDRMRREMDQLWDSFLEGGQ